MYTYNAMNIIVVCNPLGHLPTTTTSHFATRGKPSRDPVPITSQSSPDQTKSCPGATKAFDCRGPSECEMLIVKRLRSFSYLANIVHADRTAQANLVLSLVGVLGKLCKKLHDLSHHDAILVVPHIPV